MEQRGPEPPGVAGVDRFPPPQAVERAAGRGLVSRFRVQLLEAVVGRATTRLVEGVMAAFQRLYELVEAADRPLRSLLEACHPRVPCRRIVDRVRLVGPEGGVDGGRGVGTAGKRLVMLEGIRGVVGGADDGDPEVLQQSLGRESRIGQKRVAFLVDPPGASLVEDLGDPERALQLHVRPVVEGVAHRVGHRARPGLELLPVARAARDGMLRHAVRPHRAPLVMVTVEPDGGQGGEVMVGGDLIRRQVRVVVDDRQVADGVVVELLGELRLQEEVVAEEGLHAGAAASSRRTGFTSGTRRWTIRSAIRYSDPAIAKIT